MTVSETQVYALFVTVLALYFGYQRYNTKVGAKFTGYFSVQSQRGANDRIINSLHIENLKDRSIAVYDIYVQLRSGAYLHIEQFEPSPLVIGPYSVYTKEYGPVIGYKCNMTRVSVNNALDYKSEAEPMKLVLSTNFGKINAKLQNNRWKPQDEVLVSEYTMVIKPIRNNHKGISYTPSVFYIVELTNKNGDVETISLDSTLNFGKEFSDFVVPEQVLSDAKLLYEYLSMLKSWKVLDVENISVYDLRNYNNNKLEYTFGNGDELGYVSRYDYYKSTRKYAIGWFLRIPNRLKYRLKKYRIF